MPGSPCLPTTPVSRVRAARSGLEPGTQRSGVEHRLVSGASSVTGNQQRTLDRHMSVTSRQVHLSASKNRKESAMKQRIETHFLALTRPGVSATAADRGSSRQLQEQGRERHNPAGRTCNSAHRRSIAAAPRRSDGARRSRRIAPGVAGRSGTRFQTASGILTGVVPAALLAASAMTGCSENGTGNPVIPDREPVPAAASPDGAAGAPRRCVMRTRSRSTRI